jgi:hypothetical protein
MTERSPAVQFDSLRHRRRTSDNRPNKQNPGSERPGFFVSVRVAAGSEVALRAHVERHGVLVLLLIDRLGRQGRRRFTSLIKILYYIIY